MTRESIERILAVLLVTGLGGNELFHTIFDGLNFSENVEIVGTVLSMNATTDPDSWRAIDSEFVATIAYSLIWFTHAAGGLTALTGAYLLARQKAGRDDIYSGTTIAILGLGIGAVLYLIGFQTIASAWFLLYTAPTPPNFVFAAEMLFLMHMVVIVYLLNIGRR
jgi:predicted small integral membrane protein